MVTLTNNESIIKNIARDIGIMKTGIVRLVTNQSGNSRDKAKIFFEKEAQKESLYESKFGKVKSTSPTQGSGKGKGGGLGLGTGTSVMDFIKNIGNMLIKGALISLGTLGLAKLLQNDDVRKGIKDFISKMFFTVLEVIQKGAGILSDFFKENGPEIREAIIKTFQAITKLLITAIENTAEILSDKRVWEGLWSIIQAIYAGIKKVLSTKIDIGGEEVTLGTILGAVIIAFGALKGAVWLLKAAADAAAKSLFSVGGGKGGKDIPTGGGPQGGDKGGDKGGPQSKQERTAAGRESLERIERERIAQTAKDLAKAAIVAKAVVGSVAVVGTTLSVGAAQNLSGMSAEELEMLSNSGGGDDTALAAAIELQSRVPTKATTPAAKPTAPKQTPVKKDAFKEAMVKGANKASAVAPGDMEKGLLDLIAEGESASAGNYNAMNQGSIGKQILGSGNSEKVIGKKLTDMTIGEIMKRGEKNIGDGERVFAAGRYQIIPKTLKGLVAAGFVNANDKFDEATQDKLGMALLQQRGLNRYKSGEISAEEFQNSLALEWGSMANTSGTSSLGGPNVAMKGSGSKLAALLGGKGGVPTAATPVLASANVPDKPSASAPEKSMLEQLLDDMTGQLAALDQMMGGKLGIDSIALQTAFRQMDKEFMNNPTFVDSSTNVSNASAPAPGTAVSASVWDSQMTSLFVDRVA
jgi:hypothetical protein